MMGYAALHCHILADRFAMSLPRFFCETPLRAHTRLPLPEALAHHALRVLRMQAGENLILFDGAGGQYRASLEIDGKTAFAVPGEHDPREAELAGCITLVQGLPSGDKMDWIIEKAVELGAQRLIPISAQRSVVQLSGPRLEKRLAHWQRVAQAASEQSGRNRLLTLGPPRRLEQYLNETANGLRVLCHPDAPQSLAATLQAQPAIRVVTLMVGPEGGWSEEERALAHAHGVQAVSYGARVLRTETAGLALIAATSALLGWNG